MDLECLPSSLKKDTALFCRDDVTSGMRSSVVEQWVRFPLPARRSRQVRLAGDDGFQLDCRIRILVLSTLCVIKTKGNQIYNH